MIAVVGAVAGAVGGAVGGVPVVCMWHCVGAAERLRLHHLKHLFQTTEQVCAGFLLVQWPLGGVAESKTC